MVKVYPKGKMGNHLARLPIGKSVTIQKPSGRFDYQSTNVNHIGIIAGGVGIAPFICLLEYVIRSHPRVQVSVLFANQTKEDIILQKQLCQWSEENPNIELHFVLSRPDQTWNGLSGHINQHIIRECMPSPELDPLVVICGPSNMTQVATESLNSLGYCNYRVV
jgi:cytochrome-b5 reductase